jgi:predicted PurR-regulated permease PerM
MSTGSVTPNPDPDMPAAGPGSRLRRRFFLLGFLLLTIVVLVIARGILLPFLFAIVVSYVLSPVVDAMERRRPFGRQPPRWVVVVTLYLALIGGTVTIITFSVPRLASELTRLAREVPRVAAQARDEWIPIVEERVREVSARYLGPLDGQAAHAGQNDKRVEAPSPGGEGADFDTGALQIRQHANGGYEVVLPPHGIRVVPEGENGYRITAARPRNQDRDLVATLNEMLGNVMQSSQNSAVFLFNTAKSVASSLSRGIFGLVMTLMLSAYMLITSDRILDFFRSLYRPTKRHEFDDFVRRLDRGLAGVVRGQLIICLVNGVLSGIGFGLLGLKYWTFLTLVATIMSIVPIFGSILSTVPAVIVALPQGIGLALLVLAWVVAIHQLEANFLNPKIMGDAARVHPVLVVFALLAGEHLAGITGALLAVPTLSITQTLFFHLRERFLGVPRPISAPPTGRHKALAEAAVASGPPGKRNSNNNDPLPSSE